MKLLVMLFAGALALQGCGSTRVGTSELSSNYPPNYAWGYRAVGDATFGLNQTHNSQDVYLRINYNGFLKDKEGLNLYIKINGRDGVFPVQKFGSQRDILITNGYLSCSMLPTGSGYSCSPAPYSMKELLYYARDQYGKINAWDIELAAVDQDGNWDSNSGANYSYRFEALR